MKSSIILAAGLGKRVREYSLDLPKPLIEVNGKPFIEYSINIMEELRHIVLQKERLLKFH